MLMEEKGSYPYCTHTHSNQLGCVKGPGYEWHIVQENVGQWGVLLYIGHTFVDYDHDEGSDQKDSKHIYKTQNRFPDLGV